MRVLLKRSVNRNRNQIKAWGNRFASTPHHITACAACTHCFRAVAADAQLQQQTNEWYLKWRLCQGCRSCFGCAPLRLSKCVSATWPFVFWTDTDTVPARPRCENWSISAHGWVQLWTQNGDELLVKHVGGPLTRQALVTSHVVAGLRLIDVCIKYIFLKILSPAKLDTLLKLQETYTTFFLHSLQELNLCSHKNERSPQRASPADTGSSCRDGSNDTGASGSGSRRARVPCAAAAARARDFRC